jgi:sRNA-binding regulator protein Hfq
MGNDSGKDTNQPLNKPGGRQAADNRAYREETKASPNGVANRWLAEHRGKPVKVTMASGETMQGVLRAFDAYSLELSEGTLGPQETILVFKGPGVSLRDAAH